MIYFSKELLLDTEPYPRGTVLINGLTSGSGSITIKGNGVYYIEIVGAGGAAGNWMLYYSPPQYYAGGGSGAAFVGEIYLTKGTYSYGVGNSYFGNITAGIGGNAWGSYYVGYGGGDGGTLSNGASVVSTVVSANGNNGGIGAGVAANGGASLYGGYGNGAGTNYGAGSGFLRLTYRRLKP